MDKNREVTTFVNEHLNVSCTVDRSTRNGPKVDPIVGPTARVLGSTPAKMWDIVGTLETLDPSLTRSGVGR